MLLLVDYFETVVCGTDDISAFGKVFELESRRTHLVCCNYSYGLAFQCIDNHLGVLGQVVKGNLSISILWQTSCFLDIRRVGNTVLVDVINRKRETGEIICHVHILLLESDYRFGFEGQHGFISCFLFDNQVGHVVSTCHDSHECQCYYHEHFFL